MDEIRPGHICPLGSGADGVFDTPLAGQDAALADMDNAKQTLERLRKVWRMLRPRGEAAAAEWHRCGEEQASLFEWQINLFRQQASQMFEFANGFTALRREMQDLREKQSGQDLAADERQMSMQHRFRQLEAVFSDLATRDAQLSKVLMDKPAGQDASNASRRSAERIESSMHPFIWDLAEKQNRHAYDMECLQRALQEFRSYMQDLQAQVLGCNSILQQHISDSTAAQNRHVRELDCMRDSLQQVRACVEDMQTRPPHETSVQTSMQPRLELLERMAKESFGRHDQHERALAVANQSFIDAFGHATGDIEKLVAKCENLQASLREVQMDLQNGVSAREKQENSLQEPLGEIVGKQNAHSDQLEAVSDDLQMLHTRCTDLCAELETLKTEYDVNVQQRLHHVEACLDDSADKHDDAARQFGDLSKVVNDMQELQKRREHIDREARDQQASALETAMQKFDDLDKTVGFYTARHTDELEILRVKVHELHGSKAREYELRGEQFEAMERRVAHVETCVRESAELDRSELQCYRRDVDDLANRVNEECETRKAAQSVVERRVDFLERTVCDSGGRREKELDVVSVVAQEQLELGGYVAALVRDFRNTSANKVASNTGRTLQASRTMPSTSLPTHSALARPAFPSAPRPAFSLTPSVPPVR